MLPVTAELRISSSMIISRKFRSEGSEAGSLQFEGFPLFSGPREERKGMRELLGNLLQAAAAYQCSSTVKRGEGEGKRVGPDSF